MKTRITLSFYPKGSGLMTGPQFSLYLSRGEWLQWEEPKPESRQKVIDWIQYAMTSLLREGKLPVLDEWPKDQIEASQRKTLDMILWWSINQKNLGHAIGQRDIAIDYQPVTGPDGTEGVQLTARLGDPQSEALTIENDQIVDGAHRLRTLH
jgi:hypothetical protein